MATYKLLAVALAVFTNLGWGQDPQKLMCVRNYAKQGGSTVCTSFGMHYTNLRHLTEDATEVCTRIYDDFYCETGSEYEYVTNLKGKRICTLNYNQPPVANFCDSVPQFYDYIRR